jgi:hypothetical protein
MLDMAVHNKTNHQQITIQQTMDSIPQRNVRNKTAYNVVCKWDKVLYTIYKFSADIVLLALHLQRSPSDNDTIPRFPRSFSIPHTHHYEPYRDAGIPQDCSFRHLRSNSTSGSYTRHSYRDCHNGHRRNTRVCCQVDHVPIHVHHHCLRSRHPGPF